MNYNFINFQTTISELEKKCQMMVKENDVPGLSVALVSSDKILWMKGFGYIDRKKAREVDENTRFAYSSTGKSIVSAAAMKAVQEGLINLDEPLIKYYPEFYVQSIHEKDAYKKITFRHLLSHSAGLPNDGPPGRGFDENGKEYDPTFEEKIASLQGCWLTFPVGSRKRYSNFGFDLAAYGLQRASGKDYPEFVKEVLADPLGMTSLIYKRKEAFKETNTARGFLGKYEAVIRDSHDYGAGMPFLSVKDLATFARFILGRGKINGKTIVKEEYLKEMLKGDYSYDFFTGAVSRFSSYGLGMFLNSINNSIKVWHHPGGAFGYATTMVMIPEYDLGVVMMTNDEYNAPITPLTVDTIKSMLVECGLTIKEKENIDRRKDPVVKVEIEELKKLEGHYSSIGGSDIKINCKDGTLFLDHHKLTPHSKTEFSTERLPVVIFEVNSQGIPERLLFNHVEHGWWPANFIKKIENIPEPKKIDWDKFKGLYICYYYGIERSYFAIKEGETSLIMKNFDGERELFESGVKPNLFFTFNGNGYEFKEDFLLVGGNVKTFRYDNPVLDLLELSEKEPKSRNLEKFDLEFLESLLRFLENNDEADSIKQLIEKINKD